MTGEAITIRRAGYSDLPAIVDLLADDDIGRLREDPGRPLADAYLSAFQAIDADPNQLLAVAVDGDRIVGTLQISFLPGLSRKGSWRGQIEAVRIASGSRGTGIGRHMIEWAFDRCRERQCRLVQLTTDKRRPDALRFYERLNFKATHEGLKLELVAEPHEAAHKPA
ncbi:MAG: GNAT family N-acetyltransferase [Pseudomonadota bacterium]